MKIAVLINPASRAGSSSILRRALERCLRGQLFCVQQSSGPDHATALAREMIQAGVDTIVAVGGDGTVNAVVNGMVGSGCRLGIIPAGTANDLASSMEIPTNIGAACRTILDGVVRRVDVIRVNAWHFITSGGIGLPADVIESVNRLRGRSRLCRRFGRLLGPGLYPIAMCYHLFCGTGAARAVDLQLDGRRISLFVHALLVAKLRDIGKYMRIAPQASAADGRLHVFVLEAAGSRLAVAASAFRTLGGSPERGVCVRLFSGRRMTLNTESATSFCADGEQRLRGSSFDFEVVPGGIGLICPR